MPIALTIEKGPYAGVKRAEVVRRLQAMIDLLQLQKAEVSFVLTDDKRVHHLNKVYRGKDRPTDVLAFAMHEGEFGALAGHLLGDVIVSVPTARKQALARRAGPEADRVRTDVAVLDEVTMLLAHGLLHLLGWDHDTPAKDRRMRAETARLCAAAAPPSSTSVPRARVSKGRAAKPLTQKRSGGRPARRRS